MSAYIKVLKDASNTNTIYPQTKAEAVYLSDNTTTVETALGNKANSVSPTLTGTPIAPTATAGTNTTQVATTAFVMTAISNSGGFIVQDGGATGTNAPSNTHVLWIDTNSQYGNGVIKYYNGTAWVAVSTPWA